MRRKRIFTSLLAFLMLAVMAVTDMPILCAEEANGGVEEMTVEAEPLADHEATVVSSPTGKKGIIASYWTDEGSVWYDDPIALGVDHALFNIDITNLVSPTESGEAFVYNGTTYYFNNVQGTTLYYTFLRMQQIRDKGITLTVQVNMQWSDNEKLQKYIFPSGRVPGHNYYALDTSTEESREMLAAMFHYLVTKCPYVNNWIVGCEINSPEQCNYCGTLDVATNVTIAAQTYDLMYQAIQDVNPVAKNYVCLDNIWNFDNGAGIPAKRFLEEFAKLETDKTWHLAFHPYPVPYGPTADPTEWTMWAQKSADNGYLTHTQYTAFLTGANLEVLSKFVKDNYGSEHRIILTEFGFDSRAGEDSQAASLYYTYKAAERDDMIDACIYQPWTDTGWDFRQMGILAYDGTKRKIYDVFKYMDSDPTLAKESEYLAFLGINAWTDNIIKSTSTNTDDSKIVQGVYVPEDDNITLKAGAIIDTDRTDLTYQCILVDYDYAKYGTNQFTVLKTTDNQYDNWVSYNPTHPGMYGFIWRAMKDGSIISEAGGNHYFAGGTSTEPEEETTIQITGVYIPQNDGISIRAGAIIKGEGTGITYECTVIDYAYASYGTSPYPEVKKTSDKNDNWMVYKPSHPGMYGFCWRAYKDGQIISEYGATHYFAGNIISDAKIYIPDRDAETLSFGMVHKATDKENVRITWFLYRPDDGVYEAILSDGTVAQKGVWQQWTKKPGRYWIMCRVTALNNPDSSLCWGVEVRDGVVIDP